MTEQDTGNRLSSHSFLCFNSVPSKPRYVNFMQTHGYIRYTSMQAIILVFKSQSVKHFLLKYIIVRLSSSAVYLPPVDDVHIKILEYLVVCEKWCEGGQQCSVTSS